VGAVEVLHGPEALTYGEITPSSKRKEPIMRSIIVEIPPASPLAVPYTREEHKAKKNLLKLQPFEYFERSSDPKFGLRERAALQSLKGSLNKVQEVRLSTLKMLRAGLKTDGLHILHRSVQCIKRRSKWSLYDHLLTRYLLWSILEIKRAKLVLLAIGLEPDCLRHSLNVGRTRKGLPRTRLFVLDESYQPL